MKRRLFNLAAAVSLVLCVATAVLWGRSWDTSDSWHQPTKTRYYYVATRSGCVLMGTWAYGRDALNLSVPLLPIVLASLTVSGLSFVAGQRQRRRQLRGCCPACSYDLRATPDRCPECGTVASDGEKAAA